MTRIWSSGAFIKRLINRWDDAKAQECKDTSADMNDSWKLLERRPEEYGDQQEAVLESVFKDVFARIHIEQPETTTGLCRNEDTFFYYCMDDGSRILLWKDTIDEVLDLSPRLR